MAIYDAGTASLSADGTVTGVGTTWRQPLTLIRVGATMIFNTSPISIVTIAEILSDTSIRAFNDKGFIAPAGTQYFILAHDGITVQGLAQDVAETLRYYQSRETEISAAVDAFNQFDADAFQQNVTNVNNLSSQVATDASQVSADKSSVSSLLSQTESARDAAELSSSNAASSAQMAESSAQSVAGALIGTFQDGVTIQSKSQQILNIKDGIAEAYVWAGSLPKVVPANSTPESTGGLSSSAWIKLSGKSFAPVGAVGDGVADDSDAVQAQVNTGVIEFERGKSYRITRTITRDGKLFAFGGGTVINDFKGTLADPAFSIKVTRGSGSKVSDVTFDTSLVPYVIKRDTGWNVVGGIRQSKDGYIPGPQDLDIWPSVTQAQRDHNEGIGCGLLFETPNGTITDGVEISSIKGNQVNIVIQGCTNCAVLDSDFSAGQFSYSGIYFHNGVQRAYNQAILGFRLGRGFGNKVINCSVKYSSLSGISFTGNDYHEVIDCISSDNAESGFKTTQYDGNEGVSDDKAVICTRGVYKGNYAYRNYYDGFDLQSYYAGVAFEHSFGGFVFDGNISESNRLTGFHSNSSNNIFSNSTCNSCGDTGIAVIGNGNIVSSNKVVECALSPSNPQAFQIQVQGDNCSSYGNNITKGSAYSTYDYIHTGLLGQEPTNGASGIDYGNYCSGGAYRQFISQTIKGSQESLRTGGISVRFRSISSSDQIYKDDYALSIYSLGDVTLTLPPASESVGMILEFRNTNTFSVLSSMANIGQIVGGAPTNVILNGTVGSWCRLVCDGSVWLKMAER